VFAVSPKKEGFRIVIVFHLGRIFCLSMKRDKKFSHFYIRKQHGTHSGKIEKQGKKKGSCANTKHTKYISLRSSLFSYKKKHVPKAVSKITYTNQNHKAHIPQQEILPSLKRSTYKITLAI